MDISHLFDIIQNFDAQSAQSASEHSGLVPWLASALGLSDAAWYKWVAKYVDPNHPLLSHQGQSTGSIPQHPDYADTRLSDLFAGQESEPPLTLSDVVGPSEAPTTLADVVGG